MKLLGMKECVDSYAQKRGISRTQAESEFKTAVNVIADSCVDGGVSFKGLFTIKQVTRKGREGHIGDRQYKTEDKCSLKLSVGNALEQRLNEKA